MGLFSGINEARASMDSNYLRPGEYYMRVDRVKTGTNRTGMGFIAIELTCLHVLAEASDVDGKPIPPHQPGEQPTHMLMLRHDSTLPNFKAFVANCMGCCSDEVTEEVCEEITSDSQPMSGLLVHVRARDILTRAGGHFTRVSYVGPVAATTLVECMEEKDLNRFFPGDTLEKLLQQEAAA